MIKLSKTGRMYTQGMTRWRNHGVLEKGKGIEFINFMVKEYELLQQEVRETTLDQEGYTGAYMGTEGSPGNDGSSLVVSVVEYAEKASLTDTRVSDL